MKAESRRKPRWIRTTWQQTDEAKQVRQNIKRLGLHTVCEESNCPNRGECYNKGTCTFLIMGGICTRGCRFCDVTSGRPLPLDINEPVQVARSIKALGLKYAVITSVDRDDLLDDYGSKHFAQTIIEVKKLCPDVGIEVLTPDFLGDEACVHRILDAGPIVFAHNLETVRRLTNRVRDRRADYDTSLKVLSIVRDYFTGIPAKTGLMVGVGETDEEIREAMEDAYEAGAVSITIGQYLQPTGKHLKVERWVTPETFDIYAEQAREIGYISVASGPLVRSSYRAEELAVSGTLDFSDK